MRHVVLQIRVNILIALTTFVSLGNAYETASGPNDDIDAPRLFFTLPCPSLDAKDQKQFGEGRSDPFQREMLRQAILLGAREEFGLITRDPILGETLPADLDDPHIGYEVKLTREKPIEIWITTPGQKLGPYVIEKSKAGKIDGYRPMSWTCETFSREGVVDALTKLGFQHKPTPTADRAPLPQTIHERLYDMDLITQFYLARELHTLVRTQGQNAQRLAALSQVYSNLGQLTRYRLDYSHIAFHARAFLYATRATRIEPDSPEGYWAMGYAWYMFDLPGFGNGPISRADKMNEARQEPVERPAWLVLHPLYWRYDSMALMQYAKNNPGPLAELAAIFAAAAAESDDTNGLHRAVMDTCREVNPDTQRGFDVCFASKSWWLKHDEYPTQRIDRFHEAVPRLLREHAAQVPDEVLAQTIRDRPSVGEQFLDIATIAWALEDSDNNDQALELSDAVLAHQLEEMLAAVAIDLYATPSMNSLGKKPNPRTWNPIIESLQRHRYAKLFEIFRYSLLSPSKDRAAVFRKVELGDIHLPLALRLDALAPGARRFANVQGDAAWQHLYFQLTQNLPGLYALAKLYNNRSGYRTYSSWLHAGAPLSPMRAITYIRYDKLDEATLRERMERANYMPGVLTASAQWYAEQEQSEKAFDVLMDAYIMLPDKELTATTAEFALRIGKVDFWRELMVDVSNASDNIPPYEGSELTIAATYMEGQKWEEALFWAKAAYEKRPWDPESMHLAWCLHKNGKTKEGIEIMMRRDRITSQDFALRLCYLLGLDDHLDALDANYRNTVLPDRQRWDPRSPFAYDIHLMIVKGKTKQAISKLAESWKRFENTNDAIRLAILYKQHGEAVQHNQILGALASNQAKDYRSEITAKVARVILETPDQLPTNKEMASVIKSGERITTRSYAKLNFGWYLIVSEDVDRGQSLLRQILDDKKVPLYNYERYMAAVLLRQSGYNMDDYHWRLPEAHDWPK